MNYLKRLKRINERLRSLGVVEERDELCFVVYPSRAMDRPGIVREESCETAASRVAREVDLADHPLGPLHVHYRAATPTEVRDLRRSVNDE